MKLFNILPQTRNPIIIVFLAKEIKDEGNKILTYLILVVPIGNTLIKVLGSCTIIITIMYYRSCTLIKFPCKILKFEFGPDSTPKPSSFSEGCPPLLATIQEIILLYNMGIQHPSDIRAYDWRA